ncbi:MAG TPA: PAS domain S-box protein, partial [Candidatus Krumholzibacteria bacterium]|nr:PAS domain S-box protein [Candidatus Krumholzibacteria bacterium]
MLNARRIWIMTGLAIAAVWLIDAAVDALIFGKESLAEQLSAPDGHELYIRLLASSFVALTGVVWGFHARRLETTRNRLAASEANAAALVAAFPDCVVVHRGGRPLFANEAALAFLGRTDLPGLALLGVDDVIHPDDRADVLSYLASLRSGANDFVPREMRMRRGDGVYATAMVRSRLLRYEGSPAILTVFRDITAEVETRRDLVVSRERLSLALEAAQDGVWDWDIPSGRMVYSRSWATMLGLQLEDVTPDQKTWESLIHPDDHRRAMALLHAHLQGEVPIYETEVRLRHARGHYIWVLDRGKVVRRNAAGEPLRMTGTHRDITDRKEAELALEVRNRLAAAFLTGSGPEIYRSVLALVSDALGSPAGLLATVEREGALRLVAARPYTEVGRIAADRLPPMLARVTRHNHAVIEEGLVDLDGSGHTVRGAVGVPISTRDQVLGVLVVADRSDVYRVSDRAFLESLAGYLAPILQSHQANARTELQLRQAQKMEALGALAGGIAHDFNNILQAILGFTSLARGDAEDGSNLARDLDRVLKAARRGEELVRRILLFSRREEREARPADVGAMVQEAVDLLRPTLPSTIELRVAIEPGVGRIVADPAQIGQMLLNLATNALHAMERDGGAMTIRA